MKLAVFVVYCAMMTGVLSLIEGASVPASQEAGGHPLASHVTGRESGGHPLASHVTGRESGGHPLASHVTFGKKWKKLVDQILTETGGTCVAASDCDPETECCGAVFGAGMCKRRPLAGEPCDPFAVEECDAFFCECPCVAGYHCLQEWEKPGFFICRNTDDSGDKSNIEMSDDRDIHMYDGNTEPMDK